MPTTAEEIRAAVDQRFAQIARWPDRETKSPVGPASARKLGYDPQETPRRSTPYDPPGDRRPAASATTKACDPRRRLVQTTRIAVAALSPAWR
jgi:hypothetical protein